jgi:hypothetical protein
MKNELFVKQEFKDVPQRLERKVRKEFYKRFPKLKKFGTSASIYKMLDLTYYRVFVIYYHVDDDIIGYWGIMYYDNPDKILFEKEGSYNALRCYISNDIEICKVLSACDEKTSGLSLESYRKQLKEIVCDMIMNDEIDIQIYTDEPIGVFIPQECDETPKIFNVICKE